LEEILKIENLVHKYQAKNGEITALDNIGFSVNRGDIVSIVGPSGSGKSTLLSIISGVLSPTYGEVKINGEKIETVSEHVGYMLQKDYLLEWRTIFKNVVLGLEIQNKLNKTNIDYVKHLLYAYGLEEFKNKYPSQLSGGMRQRAALIRTLATKPDILLLDEAFSALDYQTRILVTEDVYRILKKENKTTLLVTHDISEAVSFSDKIIVLTGRPAKIRNIHDISFDMDNRSPVLCRDNTKFREYYSEIWKELDLNEK
jgi:NitT/TauT family transport system ATP-binding protein